MSAKNDDDVRPRTVHPKAVAKVSRAVASAMEAFGSRRASDATRRQLDLLRALDPAAPRTVNELAEQLGIRKSAASLAVSRLVARGWIQKKRAEPDGRRLEVRLTEDGRRVREELVVPDEER